MNLSIVSDIDDGEDRLHDHCGVAGIFGCQNASSLLYIALSMLQHRGQESTGIVSYQVGEDGFDKHLGRGKVRQVFPEKENLLKLRGDRAIGHLRYSTAGDKSEESAFRNIQPLFAETRFGIIAVGHNGNLTNADTLRKELEESGAVFQSTSDTAVLIHLIARSDKENIVERLTDALCQVKGAYALVVLTAHELIGIRDPHGIRPLVLGSLGKGYVLASETCALDKMEAEYIRDIEPGEIVVISEGGLSSSKPFPAEGNHPCVFENIYFSSVGSYIGNKSIYNQRHRMGEILAAESAIGADVVVPVPESGRAAAAGYARRTGIPLEEGLIKSVDGGRTFTLPAQALRTSAVNLKLSANRAVLEGRRVILVDDSIVRGTTAKRIVEMIWKAGAKEVHLRVSSPPVVHPCLYGIDTPDRDQLIAANHTIPEMEKMLGLSSLAFLSIDGLTEAVEKKRSATCSGLCAACLTGEYCH